MKWVNNLHNLVFTIIKETFFTYQTFTDKNAEDSHAAITTILKKEIFSSYHIVSYIPSFVHCDCLKT